MTTNPSHSSSQPSSQSPLHILCPICLVKNRVPATRLSEKPICGKCSASLLSASPIALDDNSLQRFVNNEDLPLLVDFWAEWCGPCKIMAPIFKEAAAQRSDVRFAKVDTETATQSSQRYAIRSIPTLILFHGGREIARQSGAMPAAQLLQWINQQLR